MSARLEARTIDIEPTVQMLVRNFSATAISRDEHGGTPKVERDALRASGLLTLSIPEAYGGIGARWSRTLDVVRQFARVDSSLAHVFGFHHLLLATVRLFGHPDQWQPWFEQTVDKRWFWGNTLNPLDHRTEVRRHEGWYEFSGSKSFCSGALDSDMLVASGIDAVSRKLLIAAIPTAREGITLAHDWNCFGQRQTDSGSARFEHVRVEANELLLDPGPLSTPFSCLRSLLAQLTFAHMFVGLTEGAFAEMKQYTLGQSRPWIKSPAQQASQDPYVLRNYGEFWVALEGARLLLERAAHVFDAAWERGTALTAQERGEVAVTIATAKVSATRVGLDLTNRLFEVAGARATHGALRLDRYWRNLRTQTLHDPVDYKLHELGDWALNDAIPAPSFYS